MKQGFGLLGVFSFALVLTLGVTGCFEKGSDSSSPIKIKQVLNMGTSAEYPPFEFRRGGEIVGIDVDIAKAISKKLGFALEIQDMDFPGLIPAMQSGKVNFLMAGLTVTEERKQSVDFSEVYYINTLSLLTRKTGKPVDWKDLAGKNVGVQLGSYMEKISKQKFQSLKFQSLNDSKLISLSKNTILVEELRSGRIEAVVLEHVQAMAFAQASPQFEVTPLTDWNIEIAQGVPDGCAIAFPKNEKLREQFNEALASLKKEGVLDQIIKKWIPG